MDLPAKMRKAEDGTGFGGENLELIFGHFTFEIFFLEILMEMTVGR